VRYVNTNFETFTSILHTAQSRWQSIRISRLYSTVLITNSSITSHFLEFCKPSLM